MKTLRKSLNGNKDHSHHISTPSSPLPPLSKPISAIQPPKKVIKALQSHRAAAPQELSFERGDFFHVMNDVTLNQGQWYEAHNPLTGARGLVPCNMFEVLGKTQASSPRVSRSSEQRPFSPNPTQSPASPKQPVYYAVVLYDFVAERADELDAAAGDTISVVAQSNREWFVAKPIGKLGRPGLIPVSFVEVRDPVTGTAIQNVNTLIDSGALPRVEEWKRSVMNYKANSISLGVLDDPKARGFPTTPAIDVQSPSPGPQQSTQPHHEQSADSFHNLLPEGILLSASVKSFHYEADEYWFLVNAVYQPYASRSSDPLPAAKQLGLFRSYNDFYDFQVDLLNAFPYEAGRPDKQTRILPFMPGPVDVVDKEITISRQQELDEYLSQLCNLQFSAKYILEHDLVRQFVSIKPGDASQDIEPRFAEINALSRPEDDVQARMSRLSVNDRRSGSDVSQYEDDTDVMGYAYNGDSYDYKPHPYASPDLLPKAIQPLRVHHRTDSSSSLHKKSTKPNPYSAHSRSSSRTNSPLPSSDRYSSIDVDTHQVDYARSSFMSPHDTSPISMRSSQTPSIATSGTSISGRSRSQSTATMNTPPISANNPQTAFVKIKIFDKASDEVVAIRVHPRVTHSQLVDKVQARLGTSVTHLRFRDSMSNGLIDLDDDDALRSWMDGTDRHVLYAE
ncbi:hypothetical protein K474DRAFT_1705378 [Panus rudis PR-1116 ss-1]|nr:hypothetical protein K474DRAFT_1705378 [Panus rudis PR-1116 ss-1]